MKQLAIALCTTFLALGTLESARAGAPESGWAWRKLASDPPL